MRPSPADPGTNPGLTLSIPTSSCVRSTAASPALIGAALLFKPWPDADRRRSQRRWGC